jgi:hypothetical protein
LVNRRWVFFVQLRSVVNRALFIVVAACGGSGTHAPKEPTSKPAQADPDPYWEWHKSRPKSPEVEMRTTRVEPPQQCGQGPYRFVVETLAAPYSESVELTICTPKGFKGSVSYQAPDSNKQEKGFGSGQDAHHEKCRVDATVVAKTTNGTGGSGGGSGKPDARGTGSKTTKATKTTPPVELKGTVIETGTKCPTGQSEVAVMSHGYTLGDEPQPGARPPMKRGPYVFELWSELPNDLTGASLLVRQRGVPAGYKLDDWRAYRQAWNTWYQKRDEMLAASRAKGHKWTTVEPVHIQ